MTDTDQVERVSSSLRLAALARADRKRLPVWTIYDHPRDCPDRYVARMYYTLPTQEPTNATLQHTELEPIRRAIEMLGYTVRLDRNPEDDPVILETWI